MLDDASYVDGWNGHVWGLLIPKGVILLRNRVVVRGTVDKWTRHSRPDGASVCLVDNCVDGGDRLEAACGRTGYALFRTQVLHGMSTTLSPAILA